MLGIRLDPETDARLDQLARQTGRPKSYFAREAIKTYLDMVTISEAEVAAELDALKGEPFDYDFWEDDVEDWKA